MSEHQKSATQEPAEIGVRRPFVIRSRFTDFDEFAESVRAWNLAFRLLDGGRFQSDVLQFGSTEAQLARARFDSHLHQQGDPPPGMRTVVIPADESQGFLWRGKRITGRTLMVFPELAELESYSKSGFAVFTYSIATDTLEQMADALEIPALDELLGGSEVLELPAGSMQALRQGAGEICDGVETEPRSVAGVALQGELRSRFPKQILLMLAARQGIEDRSTAAQRGKAMRGALGHLAEHLGEPVTVADLCRAAGASERTLRRAFHEKFGVSPKSYLTALRLVGVREELQASQSSIDKIADIANHWGFWHMGQFAADYRRRFGELPSDTLRRRLEDRR